MIGIDIARIKRWYAKNYPQFAGPAYKIVVTAVSQTDIDDDHNLDGVTLSYTVQAYDSTDLTVVSDSTKTGVYNRMHYGGWNASDSVANLEENVGGEQL